MPHARSTGASLADVTGALALLAGVVVARAGTTWGFEVAGRRAATDVLSQLRLDLVGRRLRDRPAALDGVESAEVATVAVGGLDALETAYARYLPQMVLAVVVPIAVLALAAVIDPVSAGVMLLTLPLVPVFMWLVGRYTERRAHERRQALARLATHFLDVVRGLPTLRAFNRGPAQVEQIEHVADEYRRATMGTLRVAFLSGTVLELAATLGIALVAVTVGVRLVEGGVGFEAGAHGAPPRARAVPAAPKPRGAVPRERRRPRDRDAPARPPRGRAGGRTRRRPAAAGERGCGPARERLVRVSRARTSWCSTGSTSSWPRARRSRSSGRPGAARPRSRRCSSAWRTRRTAACSPGSVDLAACDPAAWREQIAWVPQRPTLFRGTVADNIRLGQPFADDDEMRRAAALAGADAFVADLPDGYETVVGDGGRPLSAGQAQRLALARAFLRDAPLVILDEPTANLDPVSAELVGEAVDRLRGRRSVLLIVHRPELARRADRIVTLDAGRIVEPARDAA